MNAGTVLALASLGLLINEKAGIVNLGAEGMMLCAAIAGYAAVSHTGSDVLGFAAGMGAGAVLAAAFGVLVIWLGTNQYATGLALSLFGAGFSAFVGVSYVQAKLPERTQFSLPVLGDLPWVGPAMFRHHPLVYAAIALTLWLIYFLYRTRAGLVLRAVGESPESAHALGYPVRRIRLLAVVCGGCAVRTRWCLHLHHLHPAVGGGNDRGQGLDCTGLDHFCHLASGTRSARCLFVWWCHHAAISFAGHGGGHPQPIFEYAALPCHHCRAGLDFAQPHVVAREHAGFDWQAFFPWLLIYFFLTLD